MPIAPYGTFSGKIFMPLDILKSRGWLSRQPEAFQNDVLALGRVQRFRRGEMIYAVGDPPGGAYGILGGAISISIAPGAGGPHLVHQETPGWWFGEGCFLTGQPRRISLSAATDSVMFHLPLHAMERLAAEDPASTRRLAQIAMQNIDLCFRAIEDLLIPDPARRIAAVLLRCLGDDPRRTVRVSQAALGRISNTSRKVVNRTLGRFSADGLVRLGYAEIEILDIAALRRLAAGTSARGGR